MSRAALALVRVVTPPPPPDSDAELLRAFVTSGSEEAFAELVRRHGPMVLATCRRVLSNATDADDAFQATFLVLARKAQSVRRANFAGWLYGVAVRTARGVRLMRDRRLKREARAARTDVARPPADPRDADAAALIDAELARLPAHQREALVLCELQGRSRKAAAEELGIAEGTLSSRLAAAKRKLADRLSARGWHALALGPVAVPAALASATAALARGAAHVTAPASAAAAVVLKGMLFEQLRAGALACAVLLVTVCGGFAFTGVPAAEPPAPAPRASGSAAELVNQLGSDDFATREAAEKELRAMGARAEPVLRAGAKSDDPEVRARCAKLLSVIRKDALAELVRTFDAKKDAPSAHPIWKRFADTAGNTLASRALFARLLKDPDWLARLDAAETGPTEARKQYRAALGDIAEIVRGNLKVFFVIPVWPCDTPDQTAFLLFLGSYSGTDGPLPKEGFGEFIGLANVEARVAYARGLKLALEGNEIAPGPENKYDETKPLPEGSAKAFAKLLAAWLPRRAEPSPLFRGFELALAHGAADVLPAARAIAADAERPVASRVAALAAVAQFGEASDLKLFAPLFDDKTQLVIPPPPQNGDARPRSRRPVVADRALGLALLLTDRDPADFGFEHAKGKFRRANGRPVVNAYELEVFGFSSDEARAAAHKKAKEALAAKLPKP